MDLSVVSVVSEVAHTKKQEDEHLRLQREFRCMQSDRQNNIQGVHPKHKRPAKLLRRLQQEYLDLDRDLRIARSGAHKKKDEKRQLDLDNALLENEVTSIDTEAGVRLIDELDVLLLRNTKEVLSLRKIENTSNDLITERRLRSEQRLAMMENRNETAIHRFDTVYSENMNLRDQIEHMLKDRANFNQAWQKMISALSTGKKYMTDLFEQSNLAYNQRDEWCSKLRSIQEKGKMDLVLQTQEMRELQKTLDHDTELHDFLSTKGVMRINKDQAWKEEELKRKKKEERLAKFHYHENILEDIYEYTGKTRRWEIIKEFKATEQQSFSVYTILTSICAQIEVLTREVKRIRSEAKDRHEWNAANQDRLDSHNNNLRCELERQREKNSTLRANLDQQRITLDNLEARVEEMFGMLNCSLAPFQNLLGDKKPSLRGKMLDLHLMSDKIKEYLSLVFYHERHTERTKLRFGSVHNEKTSRLKKYTVFADPGVQLKPNNITRLVKADPCSVCIEARWLVRTGGVTGRREMPMSPQEVVQAGEELAADPAYEPEDWQHGITECRLPGSRAPAAIEYEYM